MKLIVRALKIFLTNISNFINDIFRKMGENIPFMKEFMEKSGLNIKTFCILLGKLELKF